MLTRVLILFVLLVPAQASALRVDEVPNPRATHAGWVTDPSGALGASAPEVEERFGTLENETGQEVALVVLPSIGDAVPRMFATALFNYWGVGKKGQDNGVLVLHVLDQRRIEIETGYGSESALPDVKCAWLIREVAIPHFRANDIPRGHAALSFGIDFALRNPDATHDQLVSSARNYARNPRTPLAAVQRGKPPIAWGWFAAALCLAIAAQCWRVKAHRLYHREQASKFSVPWVGWSLGLLLGSSMLVVDWQVDRVLPPLILLGITTFWVGARAAFVHLGARRRYRRLCTQCERPMSLLQAEDRDQALSAGQRTELALGSVAYDAWRCACGAKVIDIWPGAHTHPLCALCGFQTELRPKRKTLLAASASHTGIEELRYGCAHCGRERVVQRIIPVYVASSSSDSSWSSSSSSDSSSSSSSSDSFGGGSSGGGGAGDSY